MITRGFTGRQQSPDIAKRLPPGQSLTADFPVLSEGPTPHISTDDWSFTLKVGPKPVAKWSWAEFNALPQAHQVRDIHCVTKWSKLDTPWDGVLVDDVAEIGDAIELRGPIGGHFVWDVNDGGPLLLLGGGSGVVPLMSMLRHRAAVMSDVPALLLFSSRTFEDVIFRDELRALDARNDGFQLARTLTRDKPRRLTDFGRRVDAAMVAELVGRLPAPPRHVFVCGGNPFVEAAAQGAIRAGLSPAMIRTERYGG